MIWKWKEEDTIIKPTYANEQYCKLCKLENKLMVETEFRFLMTCT